MAFAPLYIGNYVNILHLRIEKWEKLAIGAMDIMYVGNLAVDFGPSIIPVCYFLAIIYIFPVSLL